MHNILVIRFSSLGDVVLTLPVFNQLRAEFPQARISALVKDTYADVLKAEASIDDVITLSQEESLFDLCKKIRQKKFDAILDLHANFRSRIVSAFSGAERMIRYRKAALARRLFVRWRLSSHDLKQHTLDRYLDALSRFTSQPQVLLSNAPTRMLVIQTAFLGDAVLTTPLLGALHHQFPQARLAVLCTPEIKDIFERHPAVEEVLVFDKRGKDRSLWAKWQWGRRLSAMGFDLAILPHRSFTSAWVARLAGIPRRVGFSTSQGRWFLTDTVSFQWGVHDVDRNLALMNVFGVQHPTGQLWLKPELAEAAKIGARLNAAGVKSTDKILGINAGSVWATKRWLPEGFAAVADRVMGELGAKVVFIGGAKDKETMRAILHFMEKEPIDWVGETSLKELMALVARCQVFLTNDSGPLHIAVASQVPTVAIFGPTTKELGFFPYGPGHKVIERDLACRPCGLHGANKCPQGHFKCMKDISSEEVFQAVKAQLQP